MYESQWSDGVITSREYAALNCWYFVLEDGNGPCLAWAFGALAVS